MHDGPTQVELQCEGVTAPGQSYGSGHGTHALSMQRTVGLHESSHLSFVVEPGHASGCGQYWQPIPGLHE